MIALCPGKLAVVTSSPVVDEIHKLQSTLQDYCIADRHDAIDRFETFGGPAFYVANALSHTGVQSVIYCPVSNSPHGDAYVDWIRSRGVDSQHIVRFDGRMRRNQINEFKCGQRKIVKDPLRQTFGLSHYKLEALTSSAAILVSGSVEPDVVRETIALAKTWSLQWCWNPFPLHFEMLDDAPSGGLIQMNSIEAAQVTHMALKTPSEVLARALAELTRANAVVVTCGSDGAVACTQGSCQFCEAPVIDDSPLVGLGDRLFGLWTGRVCLAGEDVFDALRWASTNLSRTFVKCRLETATEDQLHSAPTTSLIPG